MLEKLANPSQRQLAESVVSAEFHKLEIDHDRHGRANWWTTRDRVSRADRREVREASMKRLRKTYGMGPIMSAILYAVISWAIKRWLDRRFPTS